MQQRRTGGLPRTALLLFLILITSSTVLGYNRYRPEASHNSVESAWTPRVPTKYHPYRFQPGGIHVKGVQHSNAGEDDLPLDLVPGQDEQQGLDEETDVGPDFTTPDATTPDATTPDVTTPDVTTPDVTTSGPQGPGQEQGQDTDDDGFSLEDFLRLVEQENGSDEDDSSAPDAKNETSVLPDTETNSTTSTLSLAAGNPASGGTVNQASPEFVALQAQADLGKGNTTADNVHNEIQSALHKITPYNTVGAIIMIISGFLFVFFGHRLFKVVLFLGGFYFGAVLGYVVLSALEQRQISLGGNRDVVYLVVAIVAGLLIGSLFVCVWRLGLAAIGGLLGFSLAMMVLSLKEGGLIPEGIGRTIFIIVMVIAFGVLILFAERPLLIIGTSVAGSFALFLGIDTFAKAGLLDAVNQFIAGAKNGVIYTPTKYVYAELAGIVILSFIGIGVQWYATRKNKNGGSHSSRSLGHGSKGEKAALVAPAHNPNQQITIVTKH